MPQLGHYFFMKGSIVEGGGGGGGVGPDLLFQGTLGQELLYWTPYDTRHIIEPQHLINIYLGPHHPQHSPVSRSLATSIASRWDPRIIACQCFFLNTWVKLSR